MLQPVKHITVSIARSPNQVYDFAANPRNLPQWAAGLSGTKIEKVGDEWVSESGLGKVRIKFAEKNALGVMDHDVIVPSGETTHNAFRVIPNGKGSEVTFSLFRTEKMSDDQFANDAKLVTAELQKLKGLIER